jgi:hypothetical protein
MAISFAVFAPSSVLPAKIDAALFSSSTDCDMVSAVALVGPMSILWTQKVEHFLSA